MRGFVEYAIACVLAILLIGAVASMLTDAAGHRMILASGALALVVQFASFGVARAFLKSNVMVGWGLGSVLRALVLVIYGVAVAKLLRAPVAPALLSFVAFLFVTTVFEPIFLKR